MCKVRVLGHSCYDCGDEFVDNFSELLPGYQNPDAYSAIGKDIVKVNLINEDIEQIQRNTHPMIEFVTRELKSWNGVNKLLLSPGYFSRKGNMAPWDLVWSMYLVEPQLFETYKHDWGVFIRIKDVNQLKTSAKVYLEGD